MSRLIWFSQVLCLCFFLSQFRVQSSSLSPNSPPHFCRPQERFALLDFKTTVSAGNCDIGHRTIQTWNESIDCCLWEGIICNKMTGLVVGLDLSDSCIEANLTTNSSLFHLEKLQSLNLAYNDLSYPNMSFGFYIWKNLTYLNLSGTRLRHNSILFEISLLPKLVSLKLSHNNHLNLQNEMFQMLVHNLTELRSLFLDFVNMSSILPSSFLNLTFSLERLSLRYCHLQGNFPSQVFHLPSLQLLDTSENIHLGGNLPKSNWSSSLKYLALYGTNFSGELPHSLGNIKLLEELSLYDCQFYGSIPRSLANLTEITFLDFSLNQLQGLIPDVFGEMHKLSILYLHANNFSGELPASIFILTHLTNLDLSSNSLTATLPANVSGFSNLSFLSMGHNLLKGQIPSWLFSLPSLCSLDLSHNRLTNLNDHIQKPNIFLEEVNLSNNKIKPAVSTMTIDLRSNLLQGSLPNIPPSTLRLLISKNKLTGEIPPSLCNVSDLSVLDLSWNSLEGKIPECFGKFHSLYILDLQMNKFHGRIPNSIFNNSVFTFSTLNLNGNRLEGRLPPSLGKCSHLEVIDVGNNYLNDTFPHWLGVLPRLQVLVLQSNQFRGAISNSMPEFYFPQLRIIDVSRNDFMGLLPSNYFKNLKAMRNVHLGPFEQMDYGVYRYYENSVKVVMKGYEVELIRILKLFPTIDFSSNQFHGLIPEELGELNSLLLLNLSHNSLNGQIPSSLGKLAELESLDLSSNKLEGWIPEQLTNLTFLTFLNLSHNELVGHIPEEKQFSTFSNDSYIGNFGLCGIPLTKNCHEEEEPGAPPSKFEDDSTSLFDWKFVLIGYGCGFLSGFSLGYVVLATGTPWWLVKKVELYQQKFVGMCNRRKKKRRN